MQTSEYRVEKGDGAAARRIFDEMTKLYLDVYAEPPYNSGPLFRQEAFTARTNRQIGYDDFVISWATSARGDLVGFSFGFPFDVDRWWSGDASPPPAEILRSKKFAVIELVVHRDWRGRGIGRRLLSSLLDGRRENYAILTADSNAPARQIYMQWGWEQIGAAKHTAEASAMDQLVLRRPAQGY
jgi:GNAT superfamily N-acetyltransferase